MLNNHLQISFGGNETQSAEVLRSLWLRKHRDGSCGEGSQAVTLGLGHGDKDGPIGTPELLTVCGDLRLDITIDAGL